MDLKEIKTLIDLMKKNDLTEFQLEREGFKIKLRKGGFGEPVMVHSAQSAPAIYSPAPGTAPAPAPAKVEAADEGGEFTSPMVGTFYRSPSPDSSSFVEIGSTVTADSVLCIIEAMKVMNEIKAERAGTVTAVLAENGKPVQFGQPLFRIQ